jgi:hypothetical protein
MIRVADTHMHSRHELSQWLRLIARDWTGEDSLVRLKTVTRRFLTHSKCLSAKNAPAAFSRNLGSRKPLPTVAQLRVPLRFLVSCQGNGRKVNLKTIANSNNWMSFALFGE